MAELTDDEVWTLSQGGGWGARCYRWNEEYAPQALAAYSSKEDLLRDLDEVAQCVGRIGGIYADWYVRSPKNRERFTSECSLDDFAKTLRITDREARSARSIYGPRMSDAKISPERVKLCQADVELFRKRYDY